MKALARSNPRAPTRHADAASRTQYLAFILSGEAYAVRISFIREILKPLPVAEVPRAGCDILGVMSVRGRLVTVIDLRRRLRLPLATVEPKNRILLVERAGETIGLWVDEVVQVYRLSPSEIEPASVLGGEEPAYIAGVGRPPGAVLVLLDLGPLLEHRDG